MNPSRVWTRLSQETMPVRRSPHNPYTYKAPANNWPWRSLLLAGLFVFGYIVLEASTARSNGAASSSGYLAEQALRRTSQHLADAAHEADDDHLLREGAIGVRASARRAKLELKRPSARKVRKGWQPQAQAEREEQGGASSSSTKQVDDDDKAGAAAASTATTKLRGEGARAAMLEKATALERATHKIIAEQREQKQAVVTTTTAAAVPGAADSAATETAANTATSGRTSPRGALIYLVSPDRNQVGQRAAASAIVALPPPLPATMLLTASPPSSACLSPRGSSRRTPSSPSSARCAFTRARASTLCSCSTRWIRRSGRLSRQRWKRRARRWMTTAAAARAVVAAPPVARRFA